MCLPMFGALLRRKDERLGPAAPGAQEERRRAVDGDTSFLAPIHMAAEGMTRPQALPTAGTPGLGHTLGSSGCSGTLLAGGGPPQIPGFPRFAGMAVLPLPHPFFNIF